jgi:hypothetical protein
MSSAASRPGVRELSDNDSTRRNPWRTTRGRLEWWIPGAVAVILLSLVAIIYCFTGEFGSRELYSEQARAFRDGQTALEIPVSPQLLALRDPYDPKQNEPYRINDASLYRGHWYLYFSPVPAGLVYLPVDFLGGHLTDAIALLGLSTAFFVLLVPLLRRLLKSRCPRENGEPSLRWRMALFGSVVTVGATSGFFFLLRRPEIYEVAIATAVVFFVAHVLLFDRYLAAATPRPALAGATGGAIALAVGTRINYLPIALIFFAIVAMTVWRGARRTPVLALKTLAAATLPLLAVLVGLGIFNYLRFGSATENGLTYQVGGLDHKTQKTVSTDIRLRALPDVIYQTWLRPPTYSSTFPFVDVNRNFSPEAIRRERGVITAEPQVGALPMNPVLLVGTVVGAALLVLRRRARETPRSTKSSRSAPVSEHSRTHSSGLLLGYLLASSLVLFMIPSGLYGGWSERYAAEYLWPLTAFAIWGLATLYRTVRSDRVKTLVFVSSAVLLLLGSVGWFLVSSGGYVAVPAASALIVQRLGDHGDFLAVLGATALAIVIATASASGRRRSRFEARPYD